MCMPYAIGGQKRALGFLELGGSELPCRCWGLNLGPLEEQSVLLTTEPFLQPLIVWGGLLFDVVLITLLLLAEVHA